MKSTSRQNQSRVTTVCAIATLGAVLSAGCDVDGGADYSGPDAYAYGYDYYYPADLAYADAYHVDDMFGADDPRVLGARLRQLTGNALPGSALQALASGQDICPGQVTVTQRGNTAPCANGGDAVPSSTSIVFRGCQLRDGGRLDGSLQIGVAQIARDIDCDSSTLVDVRYASTAINLRYTSPTGDRVMLPTLMVTGAYTRALGGGYPASIDVTVDGQIYRSDEDDDVEQQLVVSGTQTLVPLGPGSGYRLSGTLTMTDRAHQRSCTASSNDLTRNEGCRHPTSGSIDVEHSDGTTHQWAFGPHCGDFSLEGNRTSMSDCF
jgi:hypothetical protein